MLSSGITTQSPAPHFIPKNVPLLPAFILTKTTYKIERATRVLKGQKSTSRNEEKNIKTLQDQWKPEMSSINEKKEAIKFAEERLKYKESSKKDSTTYSSSLQKRLNNTDQRSFFLEKMNTAIQHLPESYDLKIKQKMITLYNGVKYPIPLKSITKKTSTTNEMIKQFKLADIDNELNTATLHILNHCIQSKKDPKKLAQSFFEEINQTDPNLLSKILKNSQLDIHNETTNQKTKEFFNSLKI